MTLHRVLRVARTIADLAGADTVGRIHVAEALSTAGPLRATDCRLSGASSGAALRARRPNGNIVAYTVKEIFKTLQGEGRHAGRAAVFCRFAGCNLWSGREQDRASAACTFCDTDFVGTSGPGGDRFRSAEALADAIEQLWGEPSDGRFVVLTGGEPLLQVDETLTAALHDRGFEIAIETNGTLPAVSGLDWLCVSPKAGGPLQQTSGNELKLVFPQPGLDPEQVSDLEFDHFLLQPMDGPQLAANTAAAIAYCLDHPQWRLSLQTHKLIGIP